MRFGKLATVGALVTASAVLSMCQGCSTAEHRTSFTSARAAQAFDAMYPGFVATAARADGTAWVVRGYGTEGVSGEDSKVAVQATVSPDATGVAAAVVDGSRWTGRADLDALLETRSDSDDTTWSVIDAVWMETPDALIVNAQRLPDGLIAVSVVTTAGTGQRLLVSWDSDAEQWRVDGAPDGRPLPPPELPARFPPRKSDVVSVIERFALWDSDVKKVRLISGPRIVKDSHGRWWAAAVVGAKGQDDLLVYIVGESGRWSMWGSGSGVDRAELPADVRSQLGDW